MSPPGADGGRPPADPWLSHLRRDRRGLPIPYVNLWGTPSLDHTRVAHDPHIGRDATFMDDVGDVPNFTMQCPQRQRRCMVLGLCQVCERPVPWSRRNLVVSGVSVDFVTVEGRRRAVVFEPWLDDRCAHIATRWCPALIRRRRDEDLRVVPVRSKRETQLVVSEGWVEGDLEATTKARPVAMWVKVALLSQDIRPWSERPERLAVDLAPAEARRP